MQENEYDFMLIRNVLNIVHIIAYAIEKTSSYHISHCIAVGTGLVFESMISERLGLCHKDIPRQIFKAVRYYNLYHTIEIDLLDKVNAMKNDNKNTSNLFHLYYLLILVTVLKLNSR
jgi:3-dehydroquinate synthetase